jgi:hypothetical protein
LEFSTVEKSEKGSLATSNVRDVTDGSMDIEEGRIIPQTPNAQCPVWPMPNAQLPIPNSQNK